MPNAQSLFYTNEKHAKSQVREMEFIFQITGAKTSTVYPRGSDVLALYDATTQAVIDAYLGTTNEFLAAQFDATAMGTDAFACLINMTGGQVSQGANPPPSTAQGQAALVVSAEMSTQSGTNGGTIVTCTSFGPTGIAASTLSAACAVGANGNIAVRGVLTGLDALTSGMIKVIVRWVAN